MNIEISKVVGIELYRRYPGHAHPQLAYVELNCERRRLFAMFVSNELDPEVPRTYGDVIRWEIPVLHAAPANALLAEIVPFAERVCEGCLWNEHLGLYEVSDDAQEAEETIENLCNRAGVNDGDKIEAWDAVHWYSGIGNRDAQREELGITAETTNSELDEIEKRQNLHAAQVWITIIEDHQEYLAGLRDEATDDDESEAP
jgi:hypothetical protein